MNQRKSYRFAEGVQFCEENLSAVPSADTHSACYSFAKAGGYAGPAKAEFDDSSWEEVILPHDWVVSKPFAPTAPYAHGYKARGAGWYRAKFKLEEEDRDNQLSIEFDGVSSHCEVYVNGSLLHRNFCGYTGFCVDITDIAYFGAHTNTLAVKVNADIWEGWWYEGAGMYREVRLVKKPLVHVGYNGIWVNPQKIDATAWNVTIEITLENSVAVEKSVILHAEILDEQGKTVAFRITNVEIGKQERLKTVKEIQMSDPALWDINCPTLYTLVTRVECGRDIDEVKTQFGFRTVEIDADRGFFLNGRNVKLKGTCNHQDHAGVGVAVPYGVEEYRIRQLKAMGSNAYRCAHGNPSPQLLEICDKLGMLVMDENRNFNSSPEGLGQVSAMVERDRNHPCVVLYSLFNEEPLQGTPQGKQIAQRMISHVKTLDATRPVLCALNGAFFAEEGTCHLFDLTGFNYFPANYDEFHQKFPHQPMVGSETVSAYATRGCYETSLLDCVFSNYDEEKAPWGDSVREMWRSVNTRAYVLGTFAWTGFDYRGEPSPCEWPSISSHFGIMDTCGFPKDTYYLYQAYWSGETVLHLLPHWNWQGKEGQAIKVMVYSNCEEVELFLNGVSQGKQTLSLYEQFTWRVLYEPGVLKAVGYKGGSIIAEQIETTKPACKLVLVANRQQIANDSIDAIVVDVHAVDEEEHFVPTAQHTISFSIAGGAKILGVGNGNPNCHEPDKAAVRSLFNGRCQAVLQSTGENETVLLTAETKGLGKAVCVIPITKGDGSPSVQTSQDSMVEGWRVSNRASLKKPNPYETLQDCDMNSFEPVTFENKTLPQLDGKYGQYVMYKVLLPEKSLCGAEGLFFSEVKGLIEIYSDGKLLAAADCQDAQSICLPIADDRTHRDLEITVIVQCNHKEIPFAGICKPVMLQKCAKNTVKYE